MAGNGYATDQWYSKTDELRGEFNQYPTNQAFTFPNRQVWTLGNADGTKRKVKLLDRGYIRALSETGDPAGVLDAKRFKFQFNPNEWGQTVAATAGSYDPGLQTEAQVSTPTMMGTQFAFQLLLDRQMELNSGVNTDLSDTSNPWLKSDPSQVGVLHDIAVLFDICGVPIGTGATGVQGTLEGSLGNTAYLHMRPIRVVFSSLYMVDGFVTGIDVTYAKFNHSLVPMQASVNITMEAKYVGFAKAGQTFASDVALAQTEQITATNTILQTFEQYLSTVYVDIEDGWLMGKDMKSFGWYGPPGGPSGDPVAELFGIDTADGITKLDLDYSIKFYRGNIPTGGQGPSQDLFWSWNSSSFSSTGASSDPGVQSAEAFKSIRGTDRGKAAAVQGVTGPSYMSEGELFDAYGDVFTASGWANTYTMIITARVTAVTTGGQTLVASGDSHYRDTLGNWYQNNTDLPIRKVHLDWPAQQAIPTSTEASPALTTGVISDTTNVSNPTNITAPGSVRPRVPVGAN